jgi:hypothetical protein
LKVTVEVVSDASDFGGDFVRERISLSAETAVAAMQAAVRRILPGVPSDQRSAVHG